jgi:hypothetical protein
MPLISSNKPNIDFVTKEILQSNQTGSFALVQTGGTYQNVGNGFSITIQKAGRYRITAKYHADISFTTNNSNSVIVRLAVNGAEIDGTPTVSYKNVTTSGSFTLPSTIQSPIINLNAGDVITLQGYKSNTDTCQLYYSAGAYEGYIQAEMIDAYVNSIPSLTNWQTYALTIGAVTTAPTKGTIVRDVANWRRVGSNMEILYTYRQSAIGANGSGNYLFSIPAGYTIDTTITGTTAAPNYNAEASVGSGGCYNGTNNYNLIVHAYNGANLSLMSGAPATPISDSNCGLGSSAIVIISFQASVPIIGWS